MSIQPKQVLDELPDANGDVVLGILLCDRPVSERWLETVKTLRAPDGLSLGSHVIQSPGQSKDVEITAARNAIAQKTLEQGAKYLFFLDDDLLLPSDAIVKLHTALQENPKARVAGAPMPMRGWDGSRGPHFMVSVPYWEDDGISYFVTFETGKIKSVKCLSTGAMLIDVAVFSELPRPWFDWGFVRMPTNQNVDGYRLEKFSDDEFFSSLVIRAGYEILAHCGVSCEHLQHHVTEVGTLVSQL